VIVRKARRVAVAVALVLAACGSSDGGRSGAASSSTDGGGTVFLTTASPPGGGPAATSEPGAPPDSTASTDGESDSGLPGTVPPSLDGHVAVGQFAPAVLGRDRSTGVAVEVRSQDGASLRQGSLDHLTAVLGTVTGKPVSVDAGPGIPGGAKDWSADDLRTEADRQGTLPQGGVTAVLRVLVVHGTLGGDTGVLGVSVRGDTAAIFVDQVEASGSVLVGSAGIESAVVTHETGHLLGLVDLFLHTGRQDPEHPGHSTNKGSVMYWAVESSLVADLLSGGPPQDFDSADLADLATIRDGA
jgi:hypothetical protein